MTTRTDGTDLEHRIGPRGRLSIRQAAGEVRVRGVEGDTVRVRSDGGALVEVFDVDLSETSVSLKQREKLGLGGIFGRGASPELTVEVPHGAQVQLETASGDLEASDLDGQKQFRTASGDVTLQRLAGGVDVETVSGELEVDGAGPLELVARTISGDIRIRLPQLRRLEVGTTSGDVRVDAALGGDGPFSIRSISGDVTVIGRSGFRVEAETITGDLSSDVPSKRESMPGRKVLVVGRAGPTLAFKSVSGDFHVAQPRDDAPIAEPPPVAAAGVPGPPAPPAAPPAAPASPPVDASDDLETARLEILRALERGDIDVDQATKRLVSLEALAR